VQNQLEKTTSYRAGRLFLKGVTGVEVEDWLKTLTLVPRSQVKGS